MINKFYLGVPFARKDEAKSMGARWDATKKSWYVNEDSENCEKLMQLFPEFKTVELKGENRNFGGNELYVDLVPSSCWFKNVRTCVEDAEWEKLRKTIYERVNNVCECCGAKGSLEAHERWSYDDKNRIQKLERLIALCKNCHLSTHMGYAQTQGLDKQAKQHMQKVTGMSDIELQKHIKEAFVIWKERSENEYSLDISLIENADIKLKSK